MPPTVTLKTVWLYREQLTQAGVIEKSRAAMGGQIIDALWRYPNRCREENARWEDKPAKRLNPKHGKSHYGYNGTSLRRYDEQYDILDGDNSFCITKIRKTWSATAKACARQGSTEVGAQRPLHRTPAFIKTGCIAQLMGDGPQALLPLANQGVCRRFGRRGARRSCRQIFRPLPGETG